MNWTTAEVNRPQVSALRAEYVLANTVYTMSLETSFIIQQAVLVSLYRKGVLQEIGKHINKSFEFRSPIITPYIQFFASE